MRSCKFLWTIISNKSIIYTTRYYRCITRIRPGRVKEAFGFLCTYKMSKQNKIENCLLLRGSVIAPTISISCSKTFLIIQMHSPPESRTLRNSETFSNILTCWHVFRLARPSPPHIRALRRHLVGECPFWNISLSLLIRKQWVRKRLSPPTPTRAWWPQVTTEPSCYRQKKVDCWTIATRNDESFRLIPQRGSYDNDSFDIRKRQNAAEAVKMRLRSDRVPDHGLKQKIVH